MSCNLFFNCAHVSLRDILPFTLQLPEAIASAKTQKELEEVAQLGAGSLIYCLAIIEPLFPDFSLHKFTFILPQSEHFVFSFVKL